MPNKFKAGDVVVLKAEANAPKMVVGDYHVNPGLHSSTVTPYCTCSWFNSSGERKQDQFHEDTLKIAPQSE